MASSLQPKGWALVALVLLGISAAVLVWNHEPASVTAGLGASGAVPPPVPRSMQGTVQDGQVHVLADPTSTGGGLVVDAELRKFFDYHLSAVGERSLDAIRAEAEQELDRRLPSAAAAYAKRLLELYLAYKTALVDLEQRPELAGTGVAALRARLLGMQQLRARYFDEREAQGLFGFDDAYDLDAISRLEISQDPTLSDTQKQQNLAALDAARSAELRDAQDAPMAVVRLEEAAARLRQKGASDDEVYRLRAAAFDTQAASRLAEVDRDEASWKARISVYLAERDRLLRANARESEQVRLAALETLRTSQFTVEEQRRLAAYER